MKSLNCRQPLSPTYAVVVGGGKELKALIKITRLCHLVLQCIVVVHHYHLHHHCGCRQYFVRKEKPSSLSPEFSQRGSSRHRCHRNFRKGGAATVAMVGIPTKEKKPLARNPRPTRRVWRKILRRGKEKVDISEIEENLTLDEKEALDWTRLPDDTGATAEAGGIKALVDLISKWSWSASGEGVLERAAGALANLAADDKCSIEVALVGGKHALVALVRNFKVDGVQEQIILGESKFNNSWLIGRQEAAGALWNLSFDDRNREAIVAANGVEALFSDGMYSRKEIDEVRVEWADCVHDSIE